MESRHFDIYDFGCLPIHHSLPLSPARSHKLKQPSGIVLESCVIQVIILFYFSLSILIMIWRIVAAAAWFDSHLVGWGEKLFTIYSQLLIAYAIAVRAAREIESRCNTAPTNISIITHDRCQKRSGCFPPLPRRDWGSSIL